MTQENETLIFYFVFLNNHWSLIGYIILSDKCTWLSDWWVATCSKASAALIDKCVVKSPQSSIGLFFMLWPKEKGLCNTAFRQESASCPLARMAFHVVHGMECGVTILRPRSSNKQIGEKYSASPAREHKSDRRTNNRTNVWIR